MSFLEKLVTAVSCCAGAGNIFDEEVTGVGFCSVGAACSSMKRLFPSKFDEEVTGVGSCLVVGFFYVVR